MEFLIPKFNKKNFPRTEEYNLQFSKMEYGRGINYYEERLRALGFISHEKILDLACGVGQWSITMSILNEKVYGIDLLGERIRIANLIKEKNNIKNIEFSSGKSENLPYDDGYFDLVFCYGSFMFMNARATINEINRVLKKGGKVYFCINGFGWYLNLFLRSIFKFKISQTIGYFLVLINGFFWNLFGFTASNHGTFFLRKRMIKFLENNNLKLLKIDYEGKINILNLENTFKPAYKSKFLIFDNVFELICQK
jgi:SAM-dependent methyltransferase